MKRRLLCASAIALLSGLAPVWDAPLQAQESATLRPGDKVRIGIVDERDIRSGLASLPDAHIGLRRISGTLIRVESDTIFIRLNAAAAVRYALSDVEEIEYWGGNKPPAVAAVLGGFAGGIIAGLLMKNATNEELGFWFGAAPGTPLGALAGWHFMSLRMWRPISHDRVRLGGPPGQGGPPEVAVRPRAELRITIPIR